MKKRDAASVVRRFNSLDLYDDEIVSLRMEPLNGRKNLTTLIFELIDDRSEKRKWLTFSGCANLRQNIDFDVVADASFALMEKVSALRDVRRMEKFVKAHKKHWRTIYMPPSPPNLPIRRKLASIRSYVLFKVTFHGGTIEILAKSFLLSQKRPAGV